MKNLRAWIVRLCSLFMRKQQDRAFAEEMQSHLAMHIEDNLSSGMNPEEARRNALIKFGGIDRVFEEHRDRQGFRWLAEFHRNLRYALRIAWKQKALSLTVIGLLAIASGANVAIFSFYNALFLRTLPFPDAERLVDLDETAPKWNQESAYIDYTDFHEWRKENQSFDAMAIYNTPYRYYSRKGNGSYMDTMVVSSDFQSIFGIQPVLGRGFLDAECRPGGFKAAMVSYAFWQREFGGSRSALGETINLDDELYTVVGILPSNAVFLRKADVWTPLQMSPSILSRIYYLRGVGRLKKGISLEQAQEDLTRIHKNMINMRPVNRVTSPRLRFLREREFGFYGYGIIMFQIASGIMLVVVCTNIAGMMLARSESRSREIGIRTALGSSRAGILRQLLTESLLLAIPGVLLGLLFGDIFVKLIILWLGELPGWVKLSVDINILGFCGLLMGAATILFGVVPALHASGVNAPSTLHEGGMRSSASYAKRHGLSILVISEVALAFTLLVGAGLLMRTWQRLQSVDPGFQVKNILTFMIQLPRSVDKQPSDWAQFFEQFLLRSQQLPGVLAVSGAMPLPLSGGISPQYFQIDGVPAHPAGESDPLIPSRVIFPDYFKTMGMSLISGRVFTMEDGAENKVVIVNQSFARLFWPNEDPIGKRIRYKDDAIVGEWMTVVGLSRDNREYGVDRATPPSVYYPYNQAPNYAMYIVVRSTIDPAGLLNPIRSLLHEMNAELPILMPATASEALHDYLKGRQLLSTIMTLIAVFALLTASIGIYGVVSYAVSRRTHEIGIRMAVGATRNQVLRMVIGSGMRILIVGAALGLAGAIAASHALRNMLFGITSFDIPTYLITGAVLVAVVIAATLLPAKRAASVEPMRAMRSE
jgi:predicted permease